MKKKLFDTILFAVLLYVALTAFLYFYQRHLLYFPGGPRPAPEALGVPQPEIANITPEQGLDLTGWYWPATEEGKPVIVYFHGNGQAYQYWMNKTSLFRYLGFGVLFAEYRGYGGNSGKPSEQGLYRDARAYMGWLQDERDIKPEDVILYGESLGTAVAVQIATEYPVRAVVLESPFTAAVDVARRQYPIFPVSYLMHDQFLSRDKIGDIAAPLLFLHAERDGIIPIRFARELYEAAPEPKSFVTIEQGGHNDLYDSGAFPHVRQFLEAHIGKAQN